MSLTDNEISKIHFLTWKRGVNCYNEVDKMLERAKEVTRRGEYEYIE